MTTALADTTATSAINIGELMTQFANAALTGITDTVTALIPVITTVVLVGFAIKMFKKYVK